MGPPTVADGEFDRYSGGARAVYAGWLCGVCNKDDRSGIVIVPDVTGRFFMRAGWNSELLDDGNDCPGLGTWKVPLLA